MKVISNHALDLLPALPADVVVRVNLAWYPTLDLAISAIGLISKDHAIYLDYPQGRTKPPKPAITIDEAYTLTRRYENVKYLAVSNIETPKQILDVQANLPDRVEIVPKIETRKGVLNLDLIGMKCKVKTIMLDKEDLYTDCRHDAETYKQHVDLAHVKCIALGIKALELQGVIFA